MQDMSDDGRIPPSPEIKGRLRQSSGKARSSPQRPLKSAVTIRVMCAQFGVTPRALRFYEQEGLIAPDRLGRTRVYSLAQQDKLRLVLQLRDAGIPLSKINNHIAFTNKLYRIRISKSEIKALIAEHMMALEKANAAIHWLETMLPAAEDATQS